MGEYVYTVWVGEFEVDDGYDDVIIDKIGGN